MAIRKTNNKKLELDSSSFFDIQKPLRLQQYLSGHENTDTISPISKSLFE